MVVRLHVAFEREIQLLLVEQLFHQHVARLRVAVEYPLEVACHRDVERVPLLLDALHRRSLFAPIFQAHRVEQTHEHAVVSETQRNGRHSGSDFLVGIVDEVFEQFDAVAEIQKMQNNMPLVKMSDYLQQATLSEIEAKDITPDEVLKIVDADMKTMAALAKEIRDEAAGKDDFAVANMFEDYLASYSKNLWFLRAMLK